MAGNDEMIRNLRALRVRLQAKGGQRQASGHGSVNVQVQHASGEGSIVAGRDLVVVYRGPNIDDALPPGPLPVRDDGKPCAAHGRQPTEFEAELREELALRYELLDLEKEGVALEQERRRLIEPWWLRSPKRRPIRMWCRKCQASVSFVVGVESCPHCQQRGREWGSLHKKRRTIAWQMRLNVRSAADAPRLARTAGHWAGRQIKPACNFDTLAKSDHV